GSWTTWTETSAVNVSLSAGTKRIRLQATTSGGLANIDYVKITGTGMSPVACVGLKSTRELSDGASGLDANLYPVPAHHLLNIEFSEQPGETLTVSLLDLSGRLIMTDKVHEMNHTLDMSDLSAGYYILRISGIDVNIVKNIRKE
ncbi:MAG: T9SS type A sorting domain-containing protein, partial [Bacteroidales bacterium]